MRSSLGLNNNTITSNVAKASNSHPSQYDVQEEGTTVTKNDNAPLQGLVIRLSLHLDTLHHGSLKC